jgi:3-deoxy-D-manno-octulosonic acid kinase
MRDSQYRHGNQHVLFDQDVFDQLPDNIFETSASHQTVHCTDEQGRGTVVFFEQDDHQLVLKHFHRGGLAARFVKDSYLFSGISRSRMWREFRLLSQLRDLGLPVPRPVAARMVRNSTFSYQGDLIIERIPNARTLAEVLCTEGLSEKMWESIGQVIRRFHKNKVDHADLNACNILLNDNNQIFLIDFDKSKIHSQCEPRWRNANLSRLRRSLQKWKKLKPQFCFSAKNWQALERGYEGARKMPLRSNTAATDLAR